MQQDRFTVDSMHVAVPRATGIDVHSLELTATVRLCAPGLPAGSMTSRVFGTDPPALAELTGLEVKAATMEGTGIDWIVPFRALEDAGIHAELVHAQHVQPIKGRKTDRNDSVWLARVCQFGLARPSYVPPREFAELRQQCRYRRKLVADWARGAQPPAGGFRRRDPPAGRTRRAGGDRHGPWQRQLDLLETIPGIARTSAHAILAELGPEPTRVFPDAASLAAWAGVCPGHHESAGKRRSGRARPGNPTLRATLAECAHGAARTKDAQFHGYHRAMTARIGFKRAILATAHKLLRTIYAILRDDHPYHDPQVNYEQLLAQRNGPRWIHTLAKHGLLDELLALVPAA